MNDSLSVPSSTPSNLNSSKPIYTPRFQQQKQQPSSPSGKISFKDGVFTGGFDRNMRLHVRNDLYGTIGDRAVRNEVADLFYESRGHRGVTKDELKRGLRAKVRQGKMTEKQMWLVRGKYSL